MSVTCCLATPLLASDIPCPIPDTGQVSCYDHSRVISPPPPGAPYHGQDAQLAARPPAYRDNGDGTISDLVTGLTWSKAVSLQKVSLEEASTLARSLKLSGHRDWRVPNIKELYSLIDFRGFTGSGSFHHAAPADAIPFINTDYFDFAYGNIAAGERFIDAQWLSCTRSVSTTMGGAETLFGVNFADGRLKGYGFRHPGRPEKKFFVRYVRGPHYGLNQFRDNRDGTVSDLATGLTWQQNDQEPLSWQEALRSAETLVLGGHSDWRLPNAKELQYLVDYTRSPDTTGSPALDPIFSSTAITNEAGQPDYPTYWTSTTHLDGPHPAHNAATICFGRAIGQMHGTIMNVHGAGAQRSDPKIGRDEIGRGPQGDARRVKNFIRCVRGGTLPSPTPAPEKMEGYPTRPRVISYGTYAQPNPIPPSSREIIGRR